MAVEKLNKAKKILEILENNMYQACWYEALYERVTFNGDIGSAFGESYETWGVIKSQEAFHDALVMCLSRIIHGEGENTASLYALFAILKDPAVIKLLEDEAAAAAKKMKTAFINRPDVDEETLQRWQTELTERRVVDYINNLEKNLTEVKKLFEDLKSSDSKVNVSSYRNTQLAHLAIEFKPDKHKRVQYQDAPNLLAKIVPIVATCLAVINGIWVDFDEHQDFCKDSSDKYWKYAAHLTTGRVQ